MLNVTAEQIGQTRLPAQPLGDWSEKSGLSVGILLPNVEQNSPPMPLRVSPLICPCPKPQAKTLNKTQKYSVQATSERFSREDFMAAMLIPNYGGLEDREMLIKPTTQRYPRLQP
ncbi:hypothetical protein TOC8171_42390 [Pseudomonas syringae]|nr:hypothetical protein WX98_18465 [Pseudomonas syringae pv. persicae]